MTSVSFFRNELDKLLKTMRKLNHSLLKTLRQTLQPMMNPQQKQNKAKMNSRLVTPIPFILNIIVNEYKMYAKF